MTQRVPVSPEAVRRILELGVEYGADRRHISRALGVTYRWLDNVISRHIGPDQWRAALDTHRAQQDGAMEVRGIPEGLSEIERVLDIPVRSFNLDFSRPPSPATGEVTRAIVKGDSHFPFEHQPTLEAILAVAVEFEPHLFVDLGDLIDCWQISRFDKNPSRIDGLQDNIYRARGHLARVSSLLPYARKVLLEGNHEDRLRRVLWGMDGPQRELARLQKVRDALTWPSLLDLEDIGWEWLGTHEQSRADILPKVVAIHGNLIRKWSGWTAKAEWEKYGRATVNGHSHRLGSFFHRDHNGTVQSYEAGCTCQLDQEYCVDPDWQQGFLAMTWTADRSLLTVEPVCCRDGRALWRGKVYGSID